MQARARWCTNPACAISEVLGFCATIEEPVVTMAERGSATSVRIVGLAVAVVSADAVAHSAAARTTLRRATISAN